MQYFSGDSSQASRERYRSIVESLEHTYTARLWTREEISSTGQSRSPTNLRNIDCFCAGLPRLPDRGYRFKMTV